MKKAYEFSFQESDEQIDTFAKKNDTPFVSSTDAAHGSWERVLLINYIKSNHDELKTRETAGYSLYFCVNVIGIRSLTIRLTDPVSAGLYKN